MSSLRKLITAESTQTRRLFICVLYFRRSPIISKDEKTQRADLTTQRAPGSPAPRDQDRNQLCAPEQRVQRNRRTHICAAPEKGELRAQILSPGFRSPEN